MIFRGKGIIPPSDILGLKEVDPEEALRFITDTDAPEWKLSKILQGTVRPEKCKEKEIKVTHMFLQFEDAIPACPHCGKEMRYNGSKRRMWRHANLDDTVCFIHAAIPRFRCKCCSGNTQARTPWADENVSYTKRFMEVAIRNMAETSVTAVTRLMQCTWSILDSVVERVVTKYLNVMDLSTVRRIRIDETSARKRHRYITIVTDADTGQIIFITKGKDYHTIEEFCRWLTDHNGDPSNIEIISSDFSESFIKGAKLFLPNAENVYDPFHAIQMANKALDKDRSMNQVNGQRNKKLRFALLKNPVNLDEKEKELIQIVKDSNSDLARSYGMCQGLREGIMMTDPVAARAYLTGWCAWVREEGSTSFKRLGKTIEKHLDGIIRAIETGINNGYQEGVNSRVQLAKNIARGYRDPMRLARIVYFRDGLRYSGEY